MKAIQATIRASSGAVRNQGYRVEDLDELYTELSARSETLVGIREIRDITETSFTLRPGERLELFETLGSLSTSGLKIQDAVEVALELPFKGALARVVRELHARLNKGVNFSDAVSGVIRKLPPLISGMLSIGERSGQLDKVLGHCLSYLRLMQTLREKIVSASIYPAFILGLMIVGVGLLLLVFIPNLQAGLGAMKDQAQSIGAGFGRIRVLLSVLLIVLALPLALLFVYRTTRARGAKAAEIIEKAFFAFPVVGPAVSAGQLFSLSFTLEVLSESGVPLQEALSLARKTVWSAAYKTVLEGAARGLRDGSSLSQALSRHTILPPYFVRWVHVAEKTGKVGQVFGQLRAYYQKQLDLTIARVTSLVEPVLIATIGMLLLAVISTVVLPLFSIYQMKAH